MKKKKKSDLHAPSLNTTLSSRFLSFSSFRASHSFWFDTTFKGIMDAPWEPVGVPLRWIIVRVFVGHLWLRVLFVVFLPLQKISSICPVWLSDAYSCGMGSIFVLAYINMPLSWGSGIARVWKMWWRWQGMIRWCCIAQITAETISSEYKCRSVAEGPNDVLRNPSSSYATIVLISRTGSNKYLRLHDDDKDAGMSTCLR